MKRNDTVELRHPNNPSLSRVEEWDLPLCPSSLHVHRRRFTSTNYSARSNSSEIIYQNHRHCYPILTSPVHSIDCRWPQTVSLSTSCSSIFYCIFYSHCVYRVLFAHSLKTTYFRLLFPHHHTQPTPARNCFTISSTTTVLLGDDDNEWRCAMPHRSRWHGESGVDGSARGSLVGVADEELEELLVFVEVVVVVYPIKFFVRDEGT